MKKYQVTDIHPFLQDGIKFDYYNTKEIEIPYVSSCDELCRNHVTLIPDADKMLKFWITEGYIREIQEPKWTDEQLYEKVRYIARMAFNLWFANHEPVISKGPYFWDILDEKLREEIK